MPNGSMFVAAGPSWANDRSMQAKSLLWGGGGEEREEGEERERIPSGEEIDKLLPITLARAR